MMRSASNGGENVKPQKMDPFAYDIIERNSYKAYAKPNESALHPNRVDASPSGRPGPSSGANRACDQSDVANPCA
jgi:hypothetical protein